MKESSVAERIIAGLVAILVAIMGFIAVMVINLHTDVAVFGAAWEYHIDNHPNVAIENDVDEIERRLRDHEIGHPR